MFFSFRKEKPEQRFWNWFTKNLPQDFKKESEYEKVVNILSKKLIQYKRGLAVEVSNIENGVRELVISADGDRDLFPSVEKLVSEAPKINGWKMIAFRQKAPEGFSLTAGDLKLDPKEMYFYPIQSKKELDILVYISELSKHDINTVSYFGLIVVDNLLGEFDCVMKVRSYDFQELTPDIDKNSIYPLTKLSEYVNKFHKSY